MMSFEDAAATQYRCRTMQTSYVLPVGAEGISAQVWRAELMGAALREERVECYRLPQFGLEDAQVLYFPDLCRAGIAWRADAVWVDCVSPTDALNQLVRDDWGE